MIIMIIIQVITIISIEAFFTLILILKRSGRKSHSLATYAADEKFFNF